MNQPLNAGMLSTLDDNTDIMRCAMNVRTGVLGEVDYDYCPSGGQRKRRLRVFTSAEGWTIYKWYDDEGFSGMTAERPGLEQLMADAEKHRLDRMLVVAIDRLAQRIDDFSNIITNLAALPIEVTLATPAVDTSNAAGRLVRRALATLAKLKKKPMGFEPMECSMMSRNLNASPAARFMGKVMLAFLKFLRKQGDEYTARSGLLLHGADLQRKGAL